MAPRGKSPDRRSEGGFTLIEMIVTLAIMAGLAAVSYSAFAPLYARARFAWERDDVERQLLELPQRVRQSGRGGILTSRSGDNLADNTLLTVEGSPLAGKGMEEWQVMRLHLPQGWAIEVDPPIFYHFSGACEGGAVTLRPPNALVHYTLAAPLCRPIRADPQG